MNEKAQQVVEQDNKPVAQQNITPMQMLQIAVEKGADLDQLQKLMDLEERWEKNEARKAYVKAMNAFKADPPTIFKNRRVEFKGTKYDHASLDHVVDRISEAMSQHGLSFRWDAEQQDSVVSVTCVITHEMGHSESVTLQAAPDTSGSKNSIQAIGSTVAYLQRYTVLAATGLATQDMDDDGVNGEHAPRITEEQIAHLQALAKEVNADIPKFLKYLKIESLDQLPASWYDTAVKALEAKRKEKKA